jgi:hypothetical protein
VTLAILLGAIIVELAPESWSAITRFLPQRLVRRCTGRARTASCCPPGGGFAMSVGWTVAVLGVAAALVQRRDV